MKIIFLVLVALLSTLVSAKSVEELAKEAYIASINTLLIFTSQEGLNSGLYRFTNVGVDMEVYHLPFTYHLKSDSSINYFIVGNVGYSRVFISKETDIASDVRLNYENHLRTYTAGLGGGARYKFSSDLSAMAGLELIYSKSGASVKKPDDSIGDAIEDFFSQNYNDNLSYEFFANIEYRPTINEYKPYAILTYKMYETKSTFTFDSLTKFSSESSVTTLSLGCETPKLLEFDANSITLEGYYNANYLSGTVKDVVGFDTYSSLGGVVYYNTPDKPWWASHFFFEASTVSSSGLEGYNIGVGFTLDF
ncbi:hypothetical protein MNB_SM-4-1518 [hydrothermal vent metagenome]|uniref:Uncharacterized protein n=1 Tax=hydrothermal vent metagenome TaxID=652676 RepID=A0A1W1BPY4_9ZZZZ